MMKVGIGYDVHQLRANEDLYIGGVKIPSNFGSVGHSDGDALSHAIIDALLGAAGLGDIGKLFPSDDNTWRGAKSSIFLIDVMTRIKKEGYKINNIDATIILQAPKLENYIGQINKSLSEIMAIDQSSINIKATTTDKLGVVGEGLGWASMAVALLIKTS
jgi:2-C-methyl-D-erythritol 2,4-cyclodiphosphate synthase|tara:strand:+ start:224 stop:703 length:480 start_codon:yes stop_codon:yes gene_type:complete